MKVEKICLYLILGIITTIIVSIFDYSVFNSNELFLISVILLGLLVLLFIILLVLRKVNPSAYEKVLNIFLRKMILTVKNMLTICEIKLLILH